MITQKVSVDVWAMLKSMLGYFFLVILGGVFIRLVMSAITLPSRLRTQQQNVQRAMDDLKLRYPEVFKEVEEELQQEKEKKKLQSCQISEIKEDENEDNEEESTSADPPRIEEKKTN